MPIRCDIVTRERTLFSEDVDYVSLPGSEGRMGVLPHHSPLLTALDFGEVMVRNGRDEHYFAIGGGFAEIRPDQVIVLADSAEYAEDIDLERAQSARQRAEEAMRQSTPQDAAQYAQIEAALNRARIRIDVGARRSTGRRRGRMGVPDMSGEGEEL
jgi:F-type H+-transporting ATPase subunit epsilon